jgi:ribosomal protein L11 methyltransferase
VIRLALRVRREDAEVALAELLELAPGGVEEVDLGDRVEYAIYGAPGELPALPDLQVAVGDALVEVVTSEVADDWAERWKAFHQPVDVGPLRLRPPWEPPRPEAEIDLVIDPGQAFGTGGHPTTRLCLELLLDLEPGGAFADLGCGSGVLAIAAARLGWGPVLGLDFDPLAVTATAENAVANGVHVTAERGDLREQLAPGAPTVAANLLRPLLLALRFEQVPETLIASGLLREEADEVGAALSAAHDLVEERRVSGGDWCAVLFRRRLGAGG